MQDSLLLKLIISYLIKPLGYQVEGQNAEAVSGASTTGLRQAERSRESVLASRIFQ
jgi:hypothetical protein